MDSTKQQCFQFNPLPKRESNERERDRGITSDISVTKSMLSLSFKGCDRRDIFRGFKQPK